MQDHSETKERILRVLRTRGPSLPVHISTQINSSILFTSAFLSELLSEKKIKISHLRIGSSPIYFLPGQEPQLEKYSSNIKGKEKEAFLLLKEKKFLKDDEQHPAIRVALRAIKDFAIPFQKDSKLFWRYFTIPESDFKDVSYNLYSQIEKKNEAPILATKKSDELKTRKTDNEEKLNIIQKEELNIFDEKKKESKPKKKTAKKTTRKKQSQKTNEKFFDKIKEFLSQKNIEIVGIEGFNKTEIILKVRINDKEKLLVAYNKKRLTEKDITNAHKKAQEKKLNYLILSLGEPLKKLTTLMNAIKDLDGIEKIN